MSEAGQNMIYRAGASFRRAGLSVDTFAFCLCHWLEISFQLCQDIARRAYRYAEMQRTPAEGA